MKFTSNLLAQVSGSLNGNTFARNRGGMYIRNRTIPVNTETVRRTAVRATFTAGSNSWRSILTTPQRQSWTDYASTSPLTDVFGLPKVLTGQQMFMRTFAANDQIGGAIIADAPSVPGFGQKVTQFTRTEIDDGLSNFFIEGDISVATEQAGDVIVRIGTPMSPGQNFFKGPYQFVVAIPFILGATTFVDDTVSYPPVGASDRTPNEDDRFSFTARVLLDDGRLSEEFRNVETITQFIP